MMRFVLIFLLVSCFKGIGTSVREVTSIDDDGTTSGGETFGGATTEGADNGDSSSGSDVGGDDSGPDKVYKLELLSTMDLSEKGISSAPSGDICANDIWGWTDPDTNKEYAILGLRNKTSFIDVSDPKNPVHLADLKGKTSSSNWRDIKVYKNFAFIVSEASNHGLQIFDLTKLRNLDGASVREYESEDFHYARFGNAHNIVINEQTGFAYAVGATQTTGDFRACDFSLHAINIQDPTSPSFAGCISANIAAGNPPTAPIINPSENKNSVLNENPTFKECIEMKAQTESTELRPMHDDNDVCGKYYTHDAQCVVYDGPDVEHKGKEICIVSNGPVGRLESRDFDPDSFHIIDVSDKSSPKLLDTYVITENAGYAHQGWLTKDHQFFIANDELDEKEKGEPNTRTIVIDVRDLDDVKHHMYFRHNSRSIDHNLYVKGDRVYHANYNSGLMIYDISGIADREYNFLAQYDTNTSNSAVFEGMWSNYPYFESGTIIASKIETCQLLVFKESFE